MHAVEATAPTPRSRKNAEYRDYDKYRPVPQFEAPNWGIAEHVPHEGADRGRLGLRAGGLIYGSPTVGARVNTSTPAFVTSTVCSHCADGVPSVKNVLKLIDYAQHHAARPTLSCRYEEHTLDTPFNAVLRYAASLAWSDWPDLRRRLPVIRSWLQEIPLRPFGSEEIDRFRYDRLTVYYEPAHRLCRLVIDGAGVMLDEGNAAPAGSFIVDMNRVFEDFVGRWLTENVRAPFRAVLQSRHKLDAQGAIEIKPDVLIYRGSRIVGVIDAKYKLRSSGGVPGNQDAYQVLAYARRFGVRRAWLLFADDDTKARAATMMDGENTVMSVGVGLSAEWNRIVEVLTRLRDDVCSERS